MSAVPVQRQDLQVAVAAIGTINASNTAVVKAKIEGELKAVHFREGQTVHAGDLLAELDSRAQRIAVQQAEGTLARDKAQLQNARVDLGRFKDLWAKDGIAKQQVDTQEALVRQLEGTVQSDQAQVESARLQLSYTRIVAPISGQVGLKQADLGNVIKPTDANGLLSVAQTQPVHVVFAVPDTHLTGITEALRAGRPLAVEAWDREQRQRLAVGRVASTDNAIDATTGTIKLKAAFPNADARLFPNQFVNVKLKLSAVEGVLTVPAAAVLRNTDGPFVYQVGADRTVQARPVQIEVTDGDRVGLKGSLQPGDLVVVDGVDRLRDGAKVELMDPRGRRAEGGPREGRGPDEKPGRPPRSADSGVSKAEASPSPSSSPASTAR